MSGLERASAWLSQGGEVPPDQADLARDLSTMLAFDYLVPDGLDSNEVEVFDLVLPSGFTPRNEDGEVAGFELLEFEKVRERLAMPNLFTVDAALVAWNCLQRWEGAGAL